MQMQMQQNDRMAWNLHRVAFYGAANDDDAIRPEKMDYLLYAQFTMYLTFLLLHFV